VTSRDIAERDRQIGPWLATTRQRVALARAMLYDPRWGWHAAAELARRSMPHLPTGARLRTNIRACSATRPMERAEGMKPERLAALVADLGRTIWRRMKTSPSMLLISSSGAVRCPSRFTD
jgi:hypothetical protein